MIFLSRKQSNNILIVLPISQIMLSIQRKPKISASRKLMLKVSEIVDLLFLPKYNVIICLTTGEQQRSCSE